MYLSERPWTPGEIDGILCGNDLQRNIIMTGKAKMLMTLRYLQEHTDLPSRAAEGYLCPAGLTEGLSAGISESGRAEANPNGGNSL